MISSEQILSQIEKHINKAKMDPNTQTTRETFIAIRALCEVVLDSSIPAPVTPITSSTHSAPVISTQSTVLKEDNANGESLFDF